MFFFFFAPPDAPKSGVSTYAAQALLDAVMQKNLTYTEIAKKMGTSRIVINKLIEGRPISPSVLKSLLKVFDENDGNRILAAHLLDEIKRGGKDPEGFLIVEPGDSKGAFELLLRQLDGSEQRRAELVELVLKWQREDLINPAKTAKVPSSGEIESKAPDQPKSAAKRSRKRSADGSQ